MKSHGKRTGAIITAVSAAAAVFSCLFASFGTDNSPAAPAVSSAVTEAEFTVISRNPREETEVPADDTDNTETRAASLLIDINTAGESELCRLEGIGKATAEKIISYRNEHGGFSNTAQLMEINGIGEKKYEAIKDQVFVSAVIVRTVPEEPPETAISAEAAGKININTAGIDELVTLDGIGEATAEKIIAYREEHGGFSSVEEIMEVNGIGSGKFEKIRNMLCI